VEVDVVIIIFTIITIIKVVIIMILEGTTLLHEMQVFHVIEEKFIMKNKIALIHKITQFVQIMKDVVIIIIGPMDVIVELVQIMEGDSAEVVDLEEVVAQVQHVVFPDVKDVVLALM